MNERLEQGLYQEETLGDLNSAINIYSGIVDDAAADRFDIARALYHLGVCYTKLGNQQQASATFDKILGEFADQPQWVAKTRELLEAQEYLSLQLLPAPWRDAEVARFIIKTPAGVDAGLLDYVTSRTQVKGKSLWRLESYMSIAIDSLQQFSAVETLQDSGRPLHTRLNNSVLGKFEVEYGDRALRLTTDTKGVRSSVEIPFQGPLYDNEQVPGLLRRLPLAKSYQVQFPVFVASTGQVGELVLAVTGVKSVQVAAGDFNCYEIDITIYVDGRRVQMQQAWVSTDQSRQLVKYQAGHMSLELSQVSEAVTGKPVTYQNNSVNLSLSMPDGWRAFDLTSALASQHDLFIQLLPPELSSTGVLIAKAYGGEKPSEMSVDQVVDGDLQSLKNFFKNYRMRPDSRTNLNLSGLPAQSYVADYLHQDREMVEYRTYIVDKRAVYWFVFRTEKDVFEADYEQLRTLVASFSTL
ncbi:tetratricopeptide repeat protein [Exilibacterium tricleocarpae]|uniref:Tetratricopeptide repeat protein n=1 Tax=Exilibacterium tricleocarpae TaxID=2591008 RepID=A0A545T653_9GAMM|nr:tetratricopeptide repeat protein [Exilibacterium tricleocarpae]TQV72711.1 tetratricopeptide repeat protein [Exilibacterium tricleocarpae]